MIYVFVVEIVRSYFVNIIKIITFYYIHLSSLEIFCFDSKQIYSPLCNEFIYLFIYQSLLLILALR